MRGAHTNRSTRSNSTRSAHTARSRRPRVVSTRGTHSTGRAPRATVPCNLQTAPAGARGYSMAEVLATVAIILILGSLVVMNVVSFQANLRQKELDAKAEIIYTAAQEQMTRIMASGREGIFAKPAVDQTDPAVTHSVTVLSQLPADVPVNEETGEPFVEQGRLCYITSGQLTDPYSASYALFGNGGLDDELAGGNWVIEYDYKTLTVYSVFYSQGGYDCTVDYAGEGTSYFYLGLLRTWGGRLDSGKYISGHHVGYHTGAGGSAKVVQTLNPQVEIVNEEKLVATATCTRPLSVGEDLAFVVTISDGSHSRQFCVMTNDDLNDPEAVNRVEKLFQGVERYGALLDGSIAELPGITFSRVGFQNYKLEIVLDSLEGDGSLRFTNLYGSGTSGANVYTSDPQNASTTLTEGSDITVTVDVTCPGNITLKSEGAASDTKNSLFAEGSVGGVANIAVGRHLQNLDQSSGIGEKVDTAKVAASIDFTKASPAGGDLSCWLDVYENSYFNGYSADGKPKFKPISNAILKSFDGGSSAAYTIAKLNVDEGASSTAGLFATFGYGSISNVTLTGTSVKGGIVGGLLGQAASSSTPGTGTPDVLTISNCQLYLKAPGDLKGITETSVRNKSTVLLDGGSACGGLVGKASLNMKISSSFAATVAGGDMTSGLVGGLVGTVTSGSTEIRSSYADSYLLGARTGGLVGTVSGGTLSAEGCYAAGYLTATTSAAGLVDGSASVKNSYTLCATLDGPANAAGNSKVNTYHTTTHNAVGTDNVHYLGTSNNYDALDARGTAFYDANETGTSPADSLLQAFVGNGCSAFTTASRTTYPYRLLKGLDTFNWPRINDLPHYGDWERGFQEGALVYYEEYGVVTGTTTSGTKTYSRPGIFRLQGGNAEGVNLFANTYLSADEAAALKHPEWAGKEVAVVGDGYGVVYDVSKPLAGTVTVNVTKPAPSNSAMTSGTWDQVGSCTLGSSFNVDGKYLVYPLSLNINNTPAVSKMFYLRAQIGNSYYLFNPHFAETVAECAADYWPLDNYQSLSSIGLRSARQLYNMSKYYCADDGYYSVAKGLTFTQDFNVTYSAYKWKRHFNSSATPVTSQQPIGMVKGRGFNGTYEGDYHEISDVSFVTPKDAATNKSYNIAGMFGWVDKGASIQNLVLCTDYTPPSESDKGSNQGSESGSSEGSGTATDPDDTQDYEVLSNNYYVQYQGEVSSNDTVHMGVLAGYNKGTITNCATAGYFLAGADGTVHAYANSTINLGGMVGTNEGSIFNSAADSPRLRLSLYQAKTHAGGFVGRNEYGASVINCYALGAIDVVYAEGGTSDLAGFAGLNEGTVKDAYCATAISLAGETSQSYGFAPPGGYVTGCKYLHGGSFSYVGRMYAFSFNTQATSADPISYKNLKAKPSDDGYVEDSDHTFVHGVTNTVENRFPYRAVVKDEAREYVHYGNWQDDVKLGTLGVFYWEHEVGGGNAGYHMTYLGNYENTSLPVNDPERQKIQGQSTLCNAHDDTGVITEYGYGFYVDQSQKDCLVDVAWEDISCSSNKTAAGTNGRRSASSIIDGGNYNAVASDALSEQMVGAVSNAASATGESTFTFCAFTTSSETGTTAKDYICLNSPTGTGAKQNGTLKLTFNAGKTGDADVVYTYTISPFFGNALSIESISGGKITSAEIECADGRVVDCYSGSAATKEVGMSAHQYEVRSVQQLQYINWNAGKNNVTTLVDDKQISTEQYYYQSYPYLQYKTMESGQTFGSANTARAARLWLQTHDLSGEGAWDGTDGKYFAPIAGAGTSSNNEGYNATLYAWFGGSYDGQSYTIKNLAIQSKSFFVGLFGVTAGAAINNVILYGNSDKAVIERRTAQGDTVGAYAIGGLVGVAYKYVGQDEAARAISNCAVSGYKILDSSENQEGQGEVCIGGLIGVANVNLRNCSAVTDIEINCNNHGKHATWGNFIRAGGLVGGLRNSAQNCYSGGKMTVGEQTLSETYTSSGTSLGKNGIGSAHIDSSTHVFLAGIAASAFSSTFVNFDSLLEGSMIIKNCYTYMDFPTMEGTIRSITMMGSIADRYDYGNAPVIDDCYYLEKSASFAESLPSYTFSAAGTLGSVLNQTSGSKTYRQLMIDGNAVFLSKYLKNNTTDKGVSNAPKSRTYKQMSGAETGYDFVAAMNAKTADSPWEPVTTKDKALVTINGKFSYPSKEELQGKNYPFPTVITQNDLTFGTFKKPYPVHVHYGNWPIVGSYWAKGRGTMDIFTDMADDGSAYKEFTLVVDKTVDTGLSDSNIISPSFYQYLDSGSVYGSSSSIAEVVAVRAAAESNTYIVKVRAKNEGSTQIRLGSIESAAFTLAVTANWEISATAGANTAYDAESATMWLGGNDKEGKLNLMAKAAEKAVGETEVKEYSYKPALTWSASGVNLDTEITAQTSNKLATAGVKRTAEGALTLMIAATYKYSAGVSFTKQLFVTVKEPIRVGLASAREAKETEIGGKDDNQSVSPPSHTLWPFPEQDNLYLYTAAANSDVFGSISKIEIGEEECALGDPGSANYHIELDNESTYSGYAILSGRVTYKPSQSPVPETGLTVKVTFSSGNWVRVVIDKDKVGRKSASYTLSLYDRKNLGTPSESIEVGKNTALTTINRIPSISGWEFVGWFDTAGNRVTDSSGSVVSSGSGNGYTITNNEMLLSGDVSLFAKWRRHVANTFVKTNSLTQGGTYVIADSDSHALAFSGNSLSGSSSVTYATGSEYRNGNENETYQPASIVISSDRTQQWIYDSNNYLVRSNSTSKKLYCSGTDLSIKNSGTEWHYSDGALYAEIWEYTWPSGWVAEKYSVKYNGSNWSAQSGTDSKISLYKKTDDVYEYSWDPQ